MLRGHPDAQLHRVPAAGANAGDQEDGIAVLAQRYPVDDQHRARIAAEAWPSSAELAAASVSRAGVRVGGGKSCDTAAPMATYTVNERGVAKARELIAARQYVLDSQWGDVQPTAAQQNAYLERHAWVEYAGWFLGLTEGAAEDTKARYAFVYGDFRRLHRSGLIACHYRAAEWRHKAIELAAHDLLQELDRKAGIAE